MGGRGFAKSKWFGTVSEKWDWMWYRGEELPVWGYLCAVSIHLYHSSLRLHVILANGKRQQTALKMRSWYHAAGTMLRCPDDSKLCRDLRNRVRNEEASGSRVPSSSLPPPPRLGRPGSSLCNRVGKRKAGR